MAQDPSMKASKAKRVLAVTMEKDPSTKSRKAKRLRAGAHYGVGATRYALIRASAERIALALKAGYWLEATTLVESIMAERLEKRAQYLYDHTSDTKVRQTLDRVKDGFANLNPLTTRLIKVEPDLDLRAAVKKVETWTTARNAVIHAMAKLGDSASEPWPARLNRARLVANKGIEILLRLDMEERRTCHAGRGRRWSSATCPDALAPIGQPVCVWCGKD